MKKFIILGIVLAAFNITFSQETTKFVSTKLVAPKTIKELQASIIYSPTSKIITTQKITQHFDGLVKFDKLSDLDAFIAKSPKPIKKVYPKSEIENQHTFTVPKTIKELEQLMN